MIATGFGRKAAASVGRDPIRKLVFDRTNRPSVFFHCLSVFHSPFTSIPGMLTPSGRLSISACQHFRSVPMPTSDSIGYFVESV